MASTLQIKFGSVTSEAVPLGEASDTVISRKAKRWAIANGIAPIDSTNKEMADRVVAYIVRQWREQVKEWHVANERTKFEQTSRAAGDTFLDTDDAVPTEPTS